MKLNFKDYNFTINNLNGNTRIFDIIRKKYFILTPEEWVRQHVVNYLIHEINIPTGLISIEKSIVYNGLNKRFDIVAYNPNGQILLLVECKAPTVKISSKTLEQAGIYQKTIQAKYTFITNGLQHISLMFEKESNTHQLIENLPDFRKMILQL